MSRLQERLSKGRALMPFLTAGDPSEEAFLDAALGAAEGGAAALEVGIPFSDPVADGPVIQRAHQRALQAGGGVAQSLGLVSRLRERTGIPLVLFTYLNPLLAYGPDLFAQEARLAGADGVLVLDLPPEEEPGWFEFMAGLGVDPVVLDSPNTSAGRSARAIALGRGFLYAVSRVGVTGTHAGVGRELEDRILSLRSRSTLPVAVGFGITSRADVEAVWRYAECAVVGSAFVDALSRAPAGRLRDTAKRFVGELLPCGDTPKEITP